MSEDVIIRRKIGVNEEAQVEYSSYSGATLTSQFTVKSTADGLIYKMLATHTDESSAVTDLYSIGSNGTFMFGSTDLASDSTLVEFKSTEKAVLFPRLDISNIATPINGHIAYDTVTGKFKFRESGTWNTLSNGTVYNANEIVYGDGTTMGGITSSALTFNGTVLNIASNGTAGGWGKYQFKVQSSSTETGITIQNSGTGGRAYSIISTSNASGINGGMFSIGDATSSTNLLMFDASHVLYLPVLTNNGFLKTTGSNGQVTIDTTTYISNALTASYIILGNAANTATPTQVTGDITISNTGVTTIGANRVANSMMEQMSALSLKGNATNAVADPADISAGSDHQVMRRSGTAIAFGSINLASSSAVGTSLLGLANGGLNTDLSTGGAIGDLLYADATSTFARLAAVATGRVLISNGVGASPSWSTTVSIDSALIQGTTGAGYIELLAQSSNTTAGSSTGFRLFAGSTGGFNWVRKNGTDVYVRTLSATLTANRTWILPDTAGTIALLDGGQTFSNAIWNGTKIGLAYGGTNTDLSAGSAIGDMLYADTTTTFARLAAVASGSVLISNGVGVAPSWSATPSLTRLLIQGTGGSGYIELLAQSSAPSAGSSSGFRLYAGSTGGFNWVRKNGTDVYVRTLSATLTADRTWTLPDTAGTIALINGGQTFTSATWNAGVISGQYGGTGVANTGMTITLGASITTTGTLTPTLAFPTGGSGTYTFPLSSATLLANNLGLSGGTTLVGDTASGGSLNLISTSNATKGNILLGTLMVYSQANNWLALGAVNAGTVKTPAYTLDVSVGSSSSNNRLASFILTDGTSPNTSAASYAGYFDNQNSSNTSSSGTYGIYTTSRAADSSSGVTYGIYSQALAGQTGYAGYFIANGNSNSSRAYHGIYATTGGYTSTGTTATAIQGHITTSAATSTKVMILNLGYSGTKTSSEFLIDGQDNGTTIFSVRGNGDVYTSSAIVFTNASAYNSLQSNSTNAQIYGYAPGGQQGSMVIQGRSSGNSSGVVIATGSTPTIRATFGNTGNVFIGTSVAASFSAAGFSVTSANNTSNTTSVSIAGTVIQQTISAGANSQTLYGFFFKPTFNTGAFTGTSSIALTMQTSGGNNIFNCTDAGALTIGYSGGSIGFLGASAITKPSVTGSRGGNAALASLLTALANLGLITDSTTA